MDTLDVLCITIQEADPEVLQPPIDYWWTSFRIPVTLQEELEKKFNEDEKLKTDDANDLYWWLYERGDINFEVGKEDSRKHRWDYVFTRFIPLSWLGISESDDVIL